MIILNSISGPRNISTAFMYAFAQRPDTTVLDEPFYAAYLVRTGIDHPGRDEVLVHQSTDESVVVNDMLSTREKPVLFVKNMAHHIEATRKDYLQKVKNIFLIRDPARIIASYAEVIGHPSMRDIGIAFQFELFSSLLKKGLEPAVLDTALLLRDPESILRKLCIHLDIPFYPSMLYWEKGPKSYDGVWAKYWYRNVHRSTGFGKEESARREVPGHLAELCTEARTVYEQFLPYSIKP